MGKDISKKKQRLMNTSTVGEIKNKNYFSEDDKPTLNIYRFIQSAFDHFNERLYNNELPQCLLTFQREKQVMGYFSKDRWQGKKGTEHEIALNPYYFAHNNPLEIFQTIVHEMCHLWQHEFGKPSRSGYHNKEWANKMESIGLMPSDTGAPGGKKTGQRMGDYFIKDGFFYKACIDFTNSGHQLPFIERHNCNISGTAQIRDVELIHEQVTEVITESFESEVSSISLFQPIREQFFLEQIVSNKNNETSNEAVYHEQIREKKQKSVFQCPECGDKAWGKPSLSIICGKCNVFFKEGTLGGIL